MEIHAIQTGFVAVKSRQREGAGHGKARLARTFFDRNWSDRLPIYAYAIEHPEGVIVVDTGETARATEPGYFPRWHPYFRFGVREWVEPEEEIGPRLRQLGIEAGDVRKLVLTHLHTDHAGGLHHFQGIETLVTRTELELASGRRGRLRGYPNNRWPEWWNPTPVALSGPPVGPFEASLDLTETGDVTLIPLPGHTPGHIGVLIQEGDSAVLMAGDSSYSQDLMVRGAVDGVAPDERAARDTIDRIQAFCRETPTVYLVAHDPGTAARLERRETVDVGGRSQQSDA